jgi:hypothetical protein
MGNTLCPGHLVSGRDIKIAELALINNHSLTPYILKIKYLRPII